MPDTGAPWNIPYVESTDLVSDWPTDSLALANAIDSGLDAASGLVAVKHALFTGTQTASLAAGAGTAVTDLAIAHTPADSSNKIIVMFAVNGSVDLAADVRATLAARVTRDGTPIGVGDADGSRTRIFSNISATSGAGGRAALAGSFVDEPNSASEVTYRLEIVNAVGSGSTHTVYVNRGPSDASTSSVGRGASSLTLMEVKV